MPGKPKTQLNFAAQLNQFSNTIQKGDLVVVPLKTAPKICPWRDHRSLRANG